MSLITKQNRVAVLVCGHTRTWNECKESFFSMFPHDKFDIFMEAYEDQYGYHPYIQSKLNYFSDNKITSINGYYKSCRVENNVLFDCSTFDPRMRDFTHGYCQYSKLQKCLELMIRYEYDHNIKYDYVVKTRFDLVYTDEAKTIDFASIDGLILDSNNTFPNDHIIIGDRESIIDLPQFVLSEYTTPTNSLSWTNPPHGLLENYIKTKNLKTQVLNISSIKRMNKN
ncbi:MAG: hypothetical protein PHG66_04310 [Candidatus Colwellbacteria bacterium]|nr:hypothetical protein [Candidatus Colwellbacteria bacterium]